MDDSTTSVSKGQCESQSFQQTSLLSSGIIDTSDIIDRHFVHHRHHKHHGRSVCLWCHWCRWCQMIIKTFAETIDSHISSSTLAILAILIYWT